MSPTSLVPLLLLLLVATAQGIRFGPVSISSSHRGIHEEKERNLIEGSGVEAVVICRNGHCSERSRNLVSHTMSTTSKVGSKSAKSKGEGVKATLNNPWNEEMDKNQEDFTVKSPTSEQQQSNERYPDIVDIAGMDYSPAKRKPPIHN
ncbi:uncharacterized protein LOC131257507 [Magnolia sinica]|uniref:uncharacterized protein LOC131257507 n=1 Tax=Magnolia sinica TaxID=86752 RepID=UPI00265B32F4|nr:uncharacterized protein LOC131257507 [Magnolia sinica]